MATTFIYNGISSLAYGINIEPITRPILPATRERLVTIPTMDGQWDFGAYLDVTKFEFSCWIVEQRRADLNALVDGIAAWLDPRNGAHHLIVSDKPDRYWNARYSGTLDIAMIVGYGTFKLPFICVDPFSHPI